jgi:hypothetical protein
MSCVCDGRAILTLLNGEGEPRETRLILAL